MRPGTGRVVRGVTLVAGATLALPVVGGMPAWPAGASAGPAVVPVAPAPAEDVVEVDDPVTSVQCRLPPGVLEEISGLAPSTRRRGVLWANDDSGSGPVIRALDASTCRLRATLTLAGAQARDLEGMAAGVDDSGRPVLWVADIGDNADSWEYVQVYAVPQPRRPQDATVAVTTYSFTYRDRPHDGESLLADPDEPRLWAVTKQLAQGGIYALPFPMVQDTVMRAQRVADAGGLTTDGAVSPDGSRYVLRDYFDARVYDGLPPGRELALIRLPAQPQGEAVAWAPDGRALLVASERDRRLLRVELPREAWTRQALDAEAAGASAGPSSTPGTAGGGTPTPGMPTGAATDPAADVSGTAGAAASSDPGGGPGPLAVAGAAVALLAAVALGVGIFLRSR